MIWFAIDGFKEYFRIVFCNFQQFPLKVFCYSRIDDFSTVFGRKDKMVIAKINAMGSFSIVRHASIISQWEDAGTDSIPRPYGRGIAVDY